MRGEWRFLLEFEEVTTQEQRAKTATPESSRRVFSGIQPTGEFHLGNYLGAVKQWVASRSERVNFFCVVDLHAITVPQDPDAGAPDPVDGRNPVRVASTHRRAPCLYRATSAPTRRPAWILNCVTPIGWLERMTQFKDKSSDAGDILTGLLAYPVLMAADILLYDADEVPVGDDQKQHVELTRDIAERFNRLYGETFVVPEPVIPEAGARVMGLDNPAVKMSKRLPYSRPLREAAG